MVGGSADRASTGGMGPNADLAERHKDNVCMGRIGINDELLPAPGLVPPGPMAVH